MSTYCCYYYFHLEKFKEKLKIFLWNNLGSKKVKLLRIPKRAGLMRARVFGAKHATGEVSLLMIPHRNLYFILKSSKAAVPKFYCYAAYLKFEVFCDPPNM